MVSSRRFPATTATLAEPTPDPQHVLGACEGTGATDGNRSRLCLQSALDIQPHL